MYARIALTLALASALPSALAAQAAPGGTPSTAPIAKSAPNLEWTDLDPVGAPGVKIANLWGSHAGGAFGAFFKLPAGFAVPLHTHTANMKLVIVSGTYLQAPEGQPEFRLGPGSYLMQPGGNYRHTTGCDAASECVFFVESEGAFDLHPVQTGTPSAPKK
jgi:hypothetical protein